MSDDRSGRDRQPRARRTAKGTGATSRKPSSGAGGGRASRSGSKRAAPPGEAGFGPFRPAERPAVERSPRASRDASRSSEAPARPARQQLRVVGGRPAPKSGTTRRPAAGTARRRRRVGPSDVREELTRVGGRNADGAATRLMAVAEAFAEDRARDALRMVRPLRDQYPDAPSVRELTGLIQYRLGNYGAAAKELEAFVDLTDSVEQHPVLMDCYRAQRRWRRVEECWLELAAVSPSAELVAEGRIVLAGAHADQGRLDDALRLLRKRGASVRAPREHHLRTWYALADLEERAGNLAVARELFDRVRRSDPAFADVAERRAALG